MRDDIQMKCAKCGCKLDFTNAEGRYEIDEKPMCDDCFWDSFGDVIEQFPIVAPGVGHT